MASPRATISIIKCLSPQKIHNVSSIRQALSPKSPATKSFRQTSSPKTPIRNSLSAENILNGLQSPIFKIDTPYKRRIVNEGLLDECRTVLGNGAFGTVYKASYKGKEVAAKVIKNNKRIDSSIDMEKEVSFLRHSNIVRILKVDEGPAMTLVTMELCGNSLQNILEQNPIRSEQRIFIWISIAEALKYCHKMGVVHADVKPKNVLMGSDNQPKLADFGSAIFIEETETTSVFHGTPGYAAPEVVRGLHKHTILYLTGKGITPSDCDLNDDFQGEYKDLYRKSWNMRPDDRPSLLQIIKELNWLENL